MTLSSKITLEMESMIKQGVSINNISKRLKLAKSTIYYHYKEILGKKIKNPYFVKKDGEEEGEILGAFAADGSSCPQSGYQITYFFSLDEEDYAKEFAKLLESYFNKKPYFHKVKNRNVIIVRYRSKNIYYFMKEYLEWKNPKTYSVRLKILDHKKKFLKGFLRGYLDCDGYTEKNLRRTEFIGVSKKMLIQIKTILERSGFAPSLRIQSKYEKTDCFYVRLNKKDAIRFLNWVNPRNAKRKMGLRGFEFRKQYQAKA